MIKTVAYKSETEEGVESLVTIVSIDPKTGSTVLNIVQTLTVGRGSDKSTSIVFNRTWRRAMQGSPEPKWELLTNDGVTYQPVFDHNLVDEDVRMTWVRHVTAIKTGERKLKSVKSYVDKTNYAIWRDKLKAAQSTLH